MITQGVLCRVTGRYMNGTNTIAYHLVGADGSQEKANKVRVKFLCDAGLLVNMKYQLNPEKTDIIIRGKGVNLTSLPVYDEAKQKFRDDTVSQVAGNSRVNIRNSNVAEINQMGQYTILRRIIYKNQCIGYEIQDHSGRITNKKRDQVISLAVQRLISNATVGKNTDHNTGKQTMVLRGVGVELKKLPCLIVDESGQLVDPNKNVEMTVRGTRIRKNGVIRNLENNSVQTFKAGDFVLCSGTGTITVKPAEDVSVGYVPLNDAKSALCDDYIRNDKYTIEVFGSKPVYITDRMVKAWSILKSKSRVV